MAIAIAEGVDEEVWGNQPPTDGVHVRDLAKTYPGDVEALRGVSFNVHPGETFGLVGPNGAGKSTTIGILTTTVRATRGEAIVGGFDVSTQPLRARAVSSVVFQEPVVDHSLSGRRNLEIHVRLWRVDRAVAGSRIDDLAEALELGDVLDRPVETYSGGQRRRLEIARALVSAPKVLFLDEPTVGLDPRIRHELLGAIGTLRDRGDTTIVLTTHYLDEAERLCDRLAIVHQGSIVAMDTPAALLASMGTEVLDVRAPGLFQSAAATLRVHGVAGADSFVVGSTLTVPLHGWTSSAAIAAVRELDLPGASINTRPPTLDDVYLRLTGDRIVEAA